MKVIPADQAQKQINLLVIYIKDGTCEKQKWGLCDNVLLDVFDTECFKKCIIVVTSTVYYVLSWQSSA